ncbi:Man1-Src1p-C-terminal domain-containing protein [Halteromyces radiatus]|uniref:Man1-Src1p-C-terminal domain-containing protein n=1 Tax=Halteromyces radiatus TaxID=101107 RepID=UPI002220218A|nr:Man1-Src1p-C-terminal domain-containing protein [Halteromyces radiatus]KAI8082694.1 Man1-Src1p-C-terminal domain-containing protein [Halteromyces radiatus]
MDNPPTKRGRKKIERIPDGQGTDPITSTTKAKRGRPRKPKTVTTDPTEVIVKRGRGRPRGKIQKEDQLEDIKLEYSPSGSTLSSHAPHILPDKQDIKNEVLQEDNNISNAIITNDNNSDSDSDDAFIYEGTDDDDMEAEGMDDIDNDEVIYLVRDQQLDIRKGHELPILYYPDVQNRFYSIIRSFRIEHFYIISRYILLILFACFIISQVGQVKSTVRRNGYCDSDIGNNSGTGILPNLNGVNSFCIPCPANGVCVNGQLTCLPLYRPHRSITKRIINLIWPTGKTCIKDPTLVKLSRKLEHHMLQYLSRRQGHHECRHLQFASFRTSSSKSSSNTQSTNASSSSQQQDQYLVKTNRTRMIDNLRRSSALPTAHDQHHQIELDYVMEQALMNIKSNKHVITWNIDDELYLGIDVARYSVWCWCLASIFSIFALVKRMNTMITLGIPTLVILWMGYRWKMKRNRQLATVVLKALDILKKQRQLHIENPDGFGPGCSARYLRLHALESSNENTAHVWRAALQVLQHHPCLRHGYTDENGEILQYFEWL